MATCEIKFYNTKLTPERNAKLDDFLTYVNSTVENTVTTNYQKVELDMIIKINWPQANVNNLDGVNYCSLKNSDDDFTYYYFIMDSKWLSQGALELSISMDTINTFREEIAFDAKTKIIRTHKDRYVKYTTTSSSTKFNKLVDNVDEGISGLNMIRTSNSLVSASTSYQPNYRWNLVYMSDENQGMQILAYPSDYIKVGTTPTGLSHMDSLSGCESYSVGSATYTSGPWYFLSSYLNPLTYTVNIAGEVRTNASIAFLRIGNTIKLKIYNYNSSTNTYSPTTDYREVDARSFFINSDVWLSKFIYEQQNNEYLFVGNITTEDLDNASKLDWDWKSDAAYLRPISKVDRTDSRIIKIVEFPYGPCNMTATSGIYSYDTTKFEYVKSMEALRLIDLNTSLTSTVNATSNPGTLQTTMVSLASRYNYLRNDDYESKLWNSAFFKYKYVYDSFSYQIPFELMQCTTGSSTPKVTIYQYMNKSAGSTVGFKFTPSYMSTNYQQDFGEWLICDRNNEQMVLNNEYLNYIKTGFNYDVKAKNTQTTFNWVGTGLQIAGAIVGFASSGATGAAGIASGVSLAVSATASIASNINSTVSADTSLAQKLTELRNQSANVTASDSLDLFHEYSGNQIRIMQYKPTDKVRKSIADLFYYCGYADGNQGIPETDSRRWFNYIQCEPVLVENDRILKYKEDIKARYTAGVTVYHKAGLAASGSKDYDWEQKYENFETWICSR